MSALKLRYRGYCEAEALVTAACPDAVMAYDVCTEAYLVGRRGSILGAPLLGRGATPEAAWAMALDTLTAP